MRTTSSAASGWRLLGWFLQNAAGRTQAETDIQAGVFGVKVKDVMASDVPTIDPGASIHDAVFGSLLRRGSQGASLSATEAWSSGCCR